MIVRAGKFVIVIVAAEVIKDTTFFRFSGRIKYGWGFIVIIR